MTTKFIESGSAATQDLKFWTITGGSPTSVATPSFSGGRSIKCPTAAIIASPSGILQDAGSRINFYFQTDSLPLTGTTLTFAEVETSLTGIIFLQINNTGGTIRWRLSTGLSVTLATGNSLPAINTWYRIALSFTISSTSVYQVKLFVNGALEINVVNSPTLSGTGSSYLFLESGGVTGNNSYFQNIYVDDGSGVDDPGDIRVTAKLPASTNTGNWDTTIGTGAVNERGLSETNGIEESASQAQATQNYTLQAASVGDVDISQATLVSRTAWIWAKKGTTASGAFGSSAVANSVGTAGTTLAISLTAAANDLVVVCFADQVGGSTPTITDNGSGGANTYTILSGPTTNTVRKTCWFTRATHSLTTITITFGSSAKSRAAVAANFAGIPSSPLDKNPVDANDSTSPYDAPTSGTLTQASEVSIGTFALAGPGAGTTSGGNTASATDTIATSTETAVVSSGSGAIQRIASANATKSGGSSTTTLATTALTTSIGDVVVVCVADRIGSTTPTLSDSLGNTVSLLNASTNTVRMTVGFFVAVSGKSGSTTYTVTHASSNAACAIVATQFRATGGTAFTTTPKDVNPANATGTGPTAGPASGTLAQTPELIIVLGADTTTAASQTYSGTGIAAFDNATAGTTSGATAGIGYQFSAATTGVTPNMTCSQSVAAVRGTVTFKGTPAEDSVAAITYKIVNATTAVAPEITNSSANRTGVVGTVTFKANNTAAEATKLTDNGSDSSVSLTTSSALYTVITDSSSYPSNVAGIGMKSTGAAAETFLYECGTLIAYKPGFQVPEEFDQHRSGHQEPHRLVSF